jgi:predicted ribosomally synthesized peptide with SipW-like signal peptide
MNKKIIFASIFVIGMLALAMGYGTYSYFTQTETSTGNTFQAGWVDLALSTGGVYVNPWTGPLATFTNIAPGQETSATNIWFKNVGSLSGIVTVKLSYTENDAIGNDVGVSADYFASKVIITHVGVDDSSNVAMYWGLQVIDDAYGSNAANALAAGAVVSDGAGGHFATVYGVSQITLHFWDTYQGNDIVFLPNDFHKETLKLKLDAIVGNDFQYDGIDIIMTATITNA